MMLFIMSEEGNKLDIAERRKPWISFLQRTDKLESLAESRKVIQAAREQAKRTAPNMPQHQPYSGGYSGVLKVFTFSVIALLAFNNVCFLLPCSEESVQLPNINSL
ncbi:hypothetical protein MKW92_015059 [Papaver armeniacum]|nr:hypothetical protein MKW92_015059 [Papaver armeniacum]